MWKKSGREVQTEGPAKGKRNGVMPCAGEEGRVLSAKLTWHYCPDDPNIDAVYHEGLNLAPSRMLLHHSLTDM